ncbi:Bdr protein [Crocosphaera sp. XPORK-15E]|uniref:Bdr protein n=1 Tax=Crocosphaera sp. XPORK-15E TaxID=3110247 RepID=UPI002B20A536|nr:Bdr protein [Crocosphaera sp. XPORK-15E]MEA5533813.1 Bdr protein [Crocosphaera sp. XPORK-15E]
MSQTPITVTYSLEEFLTRLEQKMDRQFASIESKIDNLQQDVTILKVEVAEIKGEIKTLDARVTGQIQESDTKLTGQIKELDTKLTGQIKELDTKLTGQIQESDTKLTGQIKELDTKLTGQIKELEATVNGVSKRLDTQEFINRSVVVGFILAILAGLAKLFFPNFIN